MKEYYNSRYNLSNFFANIDTNNYNNYLSIVIPSLYIIPVFLLIFLIIFGYKIMNISIIIFIFLFVGLIIITYKLIKSLKSIQTHPLIVKYIDFFKTANTIYKENYFNSTFVNATLKDELLLSINNIENLYGDDAIFHLNNAYDILRYSELNKDNENYYTKLYIDNFKNFKFLNKSMPFIVDTTTNINNSYIIDLQLLSEKFPEEHKELLKYFNNKYYIDLKSLYQPVLFTSNYKTKFDKLVKDYKNNIYYYFWILIFFVVIILQAILLQINTAITYIYLGIIIILILLMYIYNNI